MERVQILIKTDNAAFGDYPASEIARILRRLADDFERDGEPLRPLMDINGNRVGSVIITEGE